MTRARSAASPPGPRPTRAAVPVRPRRPAPPTPDGTAVAVFAMLAVAALCGWVLLQLLVLSGLQQGRSQQVLYADLRQQLAAQTAPTGGEIEPGAPVALLTIPTLGLQQVVIEGTAPGDLLAGPGHRRDTVLPGQAGVSSIYGRATTYGGPFRTLTTLREGDGIEIVTAQGEFVYRVDGVRRAGDPAPAALAADESRLVLVTAEGSGPLAALTPDTVVYVDATLYGEPVTGSGRAAAVPAAEQPMAGDPSVLPLLALTLQGLLVAVAGVVVLRRRLPGRVLWVLAAPVIAALAWLATDTAVQLLPNLM